MELLPVPAADDPAARAAAAALAREGLLDDARPPGSLGAWRRAGLHEAVERSVMQNRGAPDSAAPSWTEPTATP